VSTRNDKITRQGFALVLAGVLLQRCVSLTLVGVGIGQATRGDQHWAWWLLAALAAAGVGTWLQRAAYAHARRIVPEDTVHD
jgi:hypothetical protein